jgi:hypothetical protein
VGLGNECLIASFIHLFIQSLAVSHVLTRSTLVGYRSTATRPHPIRSGLRYILPYPKDREDLQTAATATLRDDHLLLHNYKCSRTKDMEGPEPSATATPGDDPDLRHNHKYPRPKDRGGPESAATARGQYGPLLQHHYKSQTPKDKEGPELATTAAIEDDLQRQHQHR